MIASISVGLMVQQKKKFQKIEYRWEDHKTDYTGDYRDYCPSNFNRVFGGINYIFTERSKSSEVGKSLRRPNERNERLGRKRFIPSIP